MNCRTERHASPRGEDTGRDARYRAENASTLSAKCEQGEGSNVQDGGRVMRMRLVSGLMGYSVRTAASSFSLLGGKVAIMLSSALGLTPPLKGKKTACGVRVQLA